MPSTNWSTNIVTGDELLDTALLIEDAKGGVATSHNPPGLVHYPLKQPVQGELGGDLLRGSGQSGQIATKRPVCHFSRYRVGS